MEVASERPREVAYVAAGSDRRPSTTAVSDRW
jgi:hypothetical protein